MSDVVEKLQARAADFDRLMGNLYYYGGSDAALDRAVAAEIERLREALRPFANACYNDNGDVTIDTSHIRHGDYMRARAALSGKGES